MQHCMMQAVTSAIALLHLVVPLLLKDCFAKENMLWHLKGRLCTELLQFLAAALINALHDNPRTG